MKIQLLCLCLLVAVIATASAGKCHPGKCTKLCIHQNNGLSFMGDVYGKCEKKDNYCRCYFKHGWMGGKPDVLNKGAFEDMPPVSEDVIPVSIAALNKDQVVPDDRHFVEDAIPC